MANFSHLIERWSHSGGAPGGAARIVLRFLQFVFAVAVAGLYGVDLQNANDAGAYTDGKWVFAVLVAGLSAFTCLVYGIPPLPSFYGFGWDIILFILWTAVFGLFGNMYIDADPTPRQSGQIRMKNAVWIDLINMLLWFVTAVYATFIFWRSRKTRTLHTGAAKA